MRAIRLANTPRPATVLRVERRILFTVPYGELPSAFVSVDFEIGSVLADTVQNFVYVADASGNALRVIDTGSGEQIKKLSLAGAPGVMAITTDATRLLIALPSENTVQVVSTSTLNSLSILNVGNEITSIAAGAGNVFYGSCAIDAEFAEDQRVRQFSLETGAVLRTLTTAADYYTLVRTNSAGTRLYTANRQLSGSFDVQAFNVADPQTVSSLGYYVADASNPMDFLVDGDAIYVADGGLQGLGVFDLTHIHDTNWIDGEDWTLWTNNDISASVAVAAAPNDSSVYGLTFDFSVVQFDRTTGQAIARYDTESWETEDGLAVTPNGHLVYVTKEPQISSPDAYGIGIIGTPTIAIDEPAPITVSGRMFHDVNRNGIRDQGEGDIINAEVWLDENGNGVLDEFFSDESIDGEQYETATGQIHEYEFLLPGVGTYTVYGEGRGENGDFQEPVPTTPSKHVTATAAGQIFTDVDIGFVYSGSIDGTIFVDTNGNAKHDDGEPIDVDADVFLDLNDNGKRDKGEPRTTSDSSYDEPPTFYFIGLLPGEYTVRYINNERYALTTAIKRKIVVPENGIATVAFGVVPTANVSGTLYQDTNNNARNDQGEPRRANTLVWIDLNANGSPDPNEPRATSDGSGNYRIATSKPLPNAPIRFRDRIMGNLLSNSNRRRVDLSRLDTQLKADFLITSPTAIVLETYLDNDRNRKHNRGDNALPGVIVYIDADNDNRQDKSERSIVTNGSGYSVFDHLSPGTYVLRTRVPSRLGATTASTFTIEISERQTILRQVGLI